MVNHKTINNSQKALLYRGAFFTLFITLQLFFHLPMRGQTSLEIESKYLGSTTELQIHKIGENPKKIVYITDGMKLLENGFMETINSKGKDTDHEDVYYIFVSSVDARSGVDMRNTYFFCNENYLHFFEEELIPAAERHLDRSFSPDDRVLIGISFGGLNAAYFSAFSSSFQSYVLLSPIIYPCSEVLSHIALAENERQRVYISSGKNDAESYTNPLKKIYLSKGTEVEYVTTPGGHDFENWNGQVSSILKFIKG